MSILAQWDVSLMCYCPECRALVDLLDYPSFWEGRKLDPCEHGTERSKNIEVACPECNAVFSVDCVYYA